MKHFDEWKQMRTEIHAFNRMLLGYRICTAVVFSMFVFFSVYLVLYSPILLIFSVLFVSVMWMLDRRYSMYIAALAGKSVQFENVMREELSGHVIKDVYDRLLKAEKLVVPIFYTIMIVLGILLSWITISARVASYLPYFYAGFVVYALLYAYWMHRILKE